MRSPQSQHPNAPDAGATFADLLGAGGCYDCFNGGYGSDRAVVLRSKGMVLAQARPLQPANPGRRSDCGADCLLEPLWISGLKRVMNSGRNPDSVSITAPALKTGCHQ